MNKKDTLVGLLVVAALIVVVSAVVSAGIGDMEMGPGELSTYWWQTSEEWIGGVGDGNAHGCVIDDTGCSVRQRAYCNYNCLIMGDEAGTCGYVSWKPVRKDQICPAPICVCSCKHGQVFRCE
jgi:hypothetical protein